VNNTQVQLGTNMEKPWPNVAKETSQRGGIGGERSVQPVWCLSCSLQMGYVAIYMLQYTFGTGVPWLGKWNIGGERFCASCLVHFL
jgi:hypothetical protein